LFALTEKNMTEYGIKERHTMMKKAHEDAPDLSIEQFCHLFEVSRSWYDEYLSQNDEKDEEIALRDRIEEIILEFPGYRRVTQTLHREGK
jgi:putative transposase